MINIAYISQEGQDAITIPVAYIEAFVLMFGAFMIGYFGALFFARLSQKKKLTHYEKKINSLEEQLTALRESAKLTPESTYRKDRMDQDYEQLMFQERAFSEKVLTKSASNIPEIDFGRIGIATVSEKDDLQKIVGIGPYTEAKLNDLGIYTFAQISRFSDEDIDAVTELIKFFPDRIKNDRWVSKAKALLFEKEQENDSDSKKKMTNEKTTS